MDNKTWKHFLEWIILERPHQKIDSFMPEMDIVMDDAANRK